MYLPGVLLPRQANTNRVTRDQHTTTRCTIVVVVSVAYGGKGQRDPVPESAISTALRSSAVVTVSSSAASTAEAVFLRGLYTQKTKQNGFSLYNNFPIGGGVKR